MRDVTHVLYAPPMGAVRDEALSLLRNAQLNFVIVEWAKTGAVGRPDEICLVTSIGEFDSIDRVRTYIQSRTELAAIVFKYVRPASPREAREGRETALGSEAALAKDWLRSEEDAAWKDL
jgi:hypothetical protein